MKDLDWHVSQAYQEFVARARLGLQGAVNAKKRAIWERFKLGALTPDPVTHTDLECIAEQRVAEEMGWA